MLGHPTSPSVAGSNPDGYDSGHATRFDSWWGHWATMPDTKGVIMTTQEMLALVLAFEQAEVKQAITEAALEAGTMAIMQESNNDPLAMGLFAYEFGTIVGLV